MHKVNRLTSFILAFLLLFLPLLAAFPAITVSAEEQGDPIEVSISAQQTYDNGNAKAVGSVITLLITLSRAPITGLSVKYHTEDYGGACANASDYGAVSGKSVVFAAGETEQLVLINVKTTVSGVYLDGKEYNRTFRVVLDSATSGDGEATKITKNAVICQLPSPYVYTTKKNAVGTYYFSEYDHNVGEYRYEAWEFSDTSRTRDNIYSDQTGLYSTWNSYYVKPGYAKIYFNPVEFMAQDDTICTSHYVTYTIYAQGKALLYLKWTGEFENDGDESYIRYGQMMNTYNDHDYVSYEGLLSDYSVVNDFNVYYAKFSGYVNKRSDAGMFISLPDNTKPIYTIKMTVDGIMDHNMWTTIDTVLIDNTAPTITGCAADTVSVNNGLGTFRYSVRFSEPVQVHNANVSINVKIGDQIVTMPYLSGSGTDTLTFSCNLLSSGGIFNGYYTSARLVGVNNASGIGDFAHFGTSYSNFKNLGNNRLSTGNLDLSSQTSNTYLAGGIAMDFRDPVVTINNKSVNPGVEEVAYARLFPLTVDDVTDATLYYSFEDSKDVVNPKYDCQKTIVNTDSQSEYPISLRAEDMHGEKYLFVKVVTALKKEVTAVFYKDEDTLQSGAHGYYFTNVAPALGEITSLGTADHGRTYSFSLTPDMIVTSDGNKSPAIDALYLSVAEDRFGTNAKQYCILAREESDYHALSSTADPDLFCCTYSSCAVNIKLRGDSDIIGLTNQEGNNNGTFYIGFYAIDSVGLSSKADMVYNPYRYDMRDTFKCDVDYLGKSVLTGAKVTKGQAAQPTERVYDIKDGAVRFSLTDLKEASLFVESLRIGDAQYSFAPTQEKATAQKPYWFDAVKQFFDVAHEVAVNANDAAKNDNTLLLTPKTAGYVEIILGKLVGDGIQVSYDVYTMYFTNGKNESAVNYENTKESLVLNNRLFFIQTPFFYMLEDGKYESVNYGGTQEAPVFSSMNEARQYVNAMEQGDLYLVQLDAQLAGWLNNGEHVFKDERETTVAVAGQWWIRYKRAEWLPPTDASASTSAGDWVYYFYCKENEKTGEGIGATLPELVSAALDAVTQTVIGKGTYRNLVGSEYLDELTGEPTVAKNRLHPNYEQLTQTVRGNKLVSAIYQGDSKVYANTVVSQDKTYALASNLRTVTHTHSAMFYKTDTGYVQIALQAGKPLREMIPSQTSGVYTLLELDETGVREYEVYLDTEAPKLKVDYVSIEDEKSRFSSVYEAKNNGLSVNGKSIVLNGFDGEVDAMAYVVVYSLGEGKITCVLFASDMVGGYSLPRGTYLLEVGDRSGNIYDLNAMISAEAMVADAVVNDDQTGLIVSVSNRDEDEILRYEVYRNGELESNTFAKANLFTKNGVYKIQIRDVYGNNFVKIINFMYKAPTVRWYYAATQEGEYVRLGSEEEGESVGMTSTTLESGVEQVMTSGYVAFVVDNDVIVELDGLTKNKDYLVSTSLYTTTYTLTEKIGFSLKAYYAGYEDSAALCNCSLETEAPQFTVTAKTEKYTLPYSFSDLSTFTVKGGVAVPNSIRYLTTLVNDQTVQNGSHIKSDYVRVSVDDASGVTSFRVVKDGVLLKDNEIEYDAAKKQYLFREAGDYVLSATDLFGNSSTFVFSNEQYAVSQYSVDGSGIPPYVDQTLYGNGTVSILLEEDAMVYFLIKRADGNTDFFWYAYNGNVVKTDKTGKEITYAEVVRHRFVQSGLGVVIDETRAEDTVFSVPLSKLSAERQPVILSSDNAGYLLSASLDENGTVTFLVTLLSDSITVESRTDNESVPEPLYYKTVLSKEQSDVALLSGQEALQTNKTGAVIKTKLPFTLQVTDDNVVTVTVAFSQKQDYAAETTVYTKGGGAIPFTADQNGFYRIRITNIFGNVTEYTVHRCDSFSVIVTAVYADKAENVFDGNYEGVVRSNGQIQIRALPAEDDSVSFFLLDGEIRTPVETEDKDGWATLLITNDGDVTVLMANEYGIEKTVRCSIQAPDAPDISQLVIGFPEGADAAGGYSKDRLSLDALSVTADNLQYVSIGYGNTLTVLRNVLAQEQVVCDQSAFASCIGQLGDGDYLLTVRDEYGNTASRVLHYHGTPALLVSRMLSSSEGEETVEITQILRENGLFSNHSFTLASAAPTSTLKIKGDEVELPATRSLSTASGAFHDTFEIEYTDVYGFAYSFTAHLVRRTLSLAFSDTVTVKNVNGTDYTNDAVLVLFEEDGECKTKCTYRLDGGEERPYAAGEKLLADGRYVFTLADYAGNETHISVIRDTACEYSFTEIGMENALINYGVAGGSVRFASKNGDTVTMIRAYRNGESVALPEGTLVAEGGKWQILLEDQVGNRSFFTFYILNHSFTSFTYETPFDYVITQLWQENGERDGRISRTSYFSSVVTANQRSRIAISDNGVYSAVMKNVYTGALLTFSFTIDNTPPAVTLLGCNDGDTTIETVSLAGCTIGDRIQIYQNDTLVLDEVLSMDNSVPEITEGGDYRIVITNQAGASIVHEFSKESIVNTAGSVFIILMILLLSSMLFVGMLLRNRSRIDR